MKFLVKSLRNLLHILLICFVGQLYCEDSCPEAADIEPCICNVETSQIICSGDKGFDLNDVFKKISAKSTSKFFVDFILTNSAITSLEDHVFNGVSFKKISITGAYGLTKVSKWALNGSAYTLEEFRQMGENNLNDDNVEDLFHALSTLVVVDRIFLELTKATKVPDNAFTIINGRQINLNSIHMNYIGGKYGSLETIGNNAFYYLDNLDYLSIANQPIKLLKAHAFDFEKPSTADLDLHIEASKVTGASFEEGIFLNSKRTITIELTNNKIEYFDEKIFAPVFNMTKATAVTVIVEENPLDCSNCKNEWLVKNKEQMKYRILGTSCGKSNSLWDLTDNDFSKCHKQ